MSIQEALGKPAEAVAMEDDKVMYGIYTQRFTLTANARQRVSVDANSYMLRKGLLLRNCTSHPEDISKQPTTDICYWGGADVTVANGIPLNPNEGVVLNFRAKRKVDIWIITDQASGIQVAASEVL